MIIDKAEHQPVLSVFTRPVIDVEVYPNLFTFSAVDFDGEAIVSFEISERKNDVESIHYFLTNMKYFIGFNNIHYDNLICMYFVKEYGRIRNTGYEKITSELKILNDQIIVEEDYRAYSKYKFGHPWRSIDLFLYWSKMLRISKKLSLKFFATSLCWPRIQELPLGPDHIVDVSEIDDIISYNINDILVTKALALELRKDINLRVDARVKYGFGPECLYWDGVKLGLNIIVSRYCKRTGLSEEVIKTLRSHRTSIDIGRLILPFIQFDKADDSYITFIDEKKLVTRFKSFYGLHKYLSTLTVTTTREINCQVMLGDGNRYDVKSGGLHTYHTGAVVVRKPGQRYKDKDVSSYYPTEGAIWGFTPEHLGPECAEELNSIRLERLDLKSRGLGKGADAELLKLAMNGGFYGNTNNEYTPMYDPECMLKITINGQLMLLMLCEQLIKIGVTIDMCNTDGITILYDDALDAQVEVICNKWMVMTRMELETVEYEKVVRMNINNYLAFYYKGDKLECKEKGMFMTNPPIDASRDELVVAKAIKAYYESGKPIEQTIRTHTNIYDFCISQKVDKKYEVFWNGTKQQRLNRYYVNNNGAYLYKSKDGKSMENMMSGWTVEIFNNYIDKPMLEYNINYTYYITKTKEIINKLESTQIKLF